MRQFHWCLLTVFPQRLSSIWRERAAALAYFAVSRRLLYHMCMSFSHYKHTQDTSKFKTQCLLNYRVSYKYTYVCVHCGTQVPMQNEKSGILFSLNLRDRENTHFFALGTSLGRAFSTMVPRIWWEAAAKWVGSPHSHNPLAVCGLQCKSTLAANSAHNWNLLNALGAAR